MRGELLFEKVEDIGEVIELVDVVFGLGVDEGVDGFDIIEVSSPDVDFEIGVFRGFRLVH